MATSTLECRAVRPDAQLLGYFAGDVTEQGRLSFANTVSANLRLLIIQLLVFRDGSHDEPAWIRLSVAILTNKDTTAPPGSASTFLFALSIKRAVVSPGSLIIRRPMGRENTERITFIFQIC